MLKLKFSPLILFIILLVVLIFSTIICKTCFFNSSNTEGFVSYQYDKDTTISQNQYLVDLPQYSSKNPVTKLYDNLFFDKLNGNLIIRVTIFNKGKLERKIFFSKRFFCNISVYCNIPAILVVRGVVVDR